MAYEQQQSPYPPGQDPYGGQAMYAQAPPPQGAPVYQTYDPNAPQQQYAQYPPQQGTVVVQTQTGYVPPPPQQVVVVEQVRPSNDNDTTTAWLLFLIGFVFPILWFGGACYGLSRPNNASARLAGILCLVMALATIIGIIIAIVFVVRAFSYVYY